MDAAGFLGIPAELFAGERPFPTRLDKGPVTGEMTSAVALPLVQPPPMNSPKLAYMAYPTSLSLMVRPSLIERLAASASIRAWRPSSNPPSGSVPFSTASTKAVISAAKASP